MPGAMGTVETDFAPQLEHLSRDFRVVSFDPRGYGRSRPPARDFPDGFYERDAADAAALMKALGHDRYAILGWSDGAISAIFHAAAERDAVNGLVVWGGNAFFTEADVEAFEATRDVEKTWSDRMKATHEPVYGADLQPMWDAACDAWARIVRGPRNGDICMAEARTIACPTLVVHGAKDALCLAEHPEWFAAHIPGATLRVFPEGKHNLHLRFADEFNDEVRAFLGAD
jgi:valacyclovir hydrolase